MLPLRLHLCHLVPRSSTHHCAHMKLMLINFPACGHSARGLVASCENPALAQWVAPLEPASISQSGAPRQSA